MSNMMGIIITAYERYERSQLTTNPPPEQNEESTSKEANDAEETQPCAEE